MTSNQYRWLRAWHQRQTDRDPNWDQTRMPKAGWRRRLNQRQATALAQEAKEKESAYGPAAYVPPPPPPPPPVYSPAGFRTLAPVGVPEGGWGGGALEHTPGQLISGQPPAPPPTQPGGVSMPVPIDLWPTEPYRQPGYAPPGMESIGQTGSGNQIWGPKRPGKPGISPGTPISPRTNAMREY